MKRMTFDEIVLEKEMGRPVYWRNGFAWIGKYYSSKFWNPFDWYKVKIRVDKQLTLCYNKDR